MNSHEITLGQDADIQFSEHSMFLSSQAFLNKSLMEWSQGSPPQKIPNRQINSDVTFQANERMMTKVIHMVENVYHVTTASPTRDNSEPVFPQGLSLLCRNCFRIIIIIDRMAVIIIIYWNLTRSRHYAKHNTWIFHTISHNPVRVKLYEETEAQRS